MSVKKFISPQSEDMYHMAISTDLKNKEKIKISNKSILMIVEPKNKLKKKDKT